MLDVLNFLPHLLRDYKFSGFLTLSILRAPTVMLQSQCLPFFHSATSIDILIKLFQHHFCVLFLSTSFPSSPRFLLRHLFSFSSEANYSSFITDHSQPAILHYFLHHPFRLFFQFSQCICTFSCPKVICIRASFWMCSNFSLWVLTILFSLATFFPIPWYLFCPTIAEV